MTTHAATPAQYSYVLITPARNEGAFIEETIKSVIGQTVPPLRWVIVSDGSTDATDDIVRNYASRHAWIELLRMPERKERHFAGKVYAFNAGYEKVRGLQYDLIGSLDADISFDPGYFEFLLAKFSQDPQLGLAGTPFSEGKVKYDFRVTRKEHVSGACQLFRRACFESVGGYVPLKAGAVDSRCSGYCADERMEDGKRLLIRSVFITVRWGLRSTAFWFLLSGMDTTTFRWGYIRYGKYSGPSIT